jgi:FAD/FMN-containing dehydrogenase
MNVTSEPNSWGLVFHPKQVVHLYRDRSAALPSTRTSLLPFGNGRSYGDSCLNDGGDLIDCRPLSRFLSFDDQSGVVRCESGVTLASIIETMLPRGWFLPVTPGTKYVTVGGAIANDVHGKNHHVAGSFGHHVVQFELLRSDGSRTVCSPRDNRDRYAATIGGLGLTGLITWVEIRLKRVSGPTIIQRAYRFGNLQEFFALSHDLSNEHEYAVAWLDCLTKGAQLGRGVFFVGDHDSKAEPARRSAYTFNVPAMPPFSLVNGLSLRLFNQAYYTRHRLGAVDRVDLESFFYPLDRIRNWNRIYGPRGFLQYQCVVPNSSAGREALIEIVDRIASSGKGSFLAVLKEFGSMASAGMMSFPQHGYTLALDFPASSTSIFELLDELDGKVAKVGGRVYPAKDARMSAQSFQRFFPQWHQFSAHIDPRFSSSFWRRVTGIVKSNGVDACAAYSS